MALIPSTSYAGQIDDSDPEMPHGKAVNETSEGANDGTPLEQAWLNDLWGFLQSLLVASGITPSGTPDKVGASQYLDALLTLTARRYAVFSVGGSNIDDGVKFNLSAVMNTGGFVLASNEIEVPVPGKYRIHYAIPLNIAGATPPYETGLQFQGLGGTVIGENSISNSAPVMVSGFFVGTITTPSSQKIWVESNKDNQATAFGGVIMLEFLGP